MLNFAHALEKSLHVTLFDCITFLCGYLLLKLKTIPIQFTDKFDPLLNNKKKTDKTINNQSNQVSMAAIHHPSNFQLIISLQTSKGLMPPKHARSRFDKGHPPCHLKKNAYLSCAIDRH